MIVAQGRPEDIAQSKASHTGHFLKEVLARRPIKNTSAEPAKVKKTSKR